MKTLVIRATDVAIGNFPKVGKHSIQIRRGVDPNATISIDFRSTTANTKIEFSGAVAIVGGAEVSEVTLPTANTFVTVTVRAKAEVGYIYLPSSVVWAMKQNWLTTTLDSPKINYSETFRDLNSTESMFRDSKNFDSPVTIASSVLTNISQMFESAENFNSKLTIPTHNVTNMTRTFFGSRFNQDISGWNTSNVTLMAGTFFNNRAFNQDISAWDVSKVTNMRTMFQNATAFNRDISSWNFNKEVILEDFMAGKTVDNYNPVFYSSLLSKLNSIDFTGRVQSKVLQVGGIKYTSAGAASRASLVSKGWTIVDGGQIA